jgi:hypothetical protein
VRYTNGYRREYEVLPDGTAAWTIPTRSGRGKLQRDEGGAWLIANDGDGNVERWTLAGDRLFVEHFSPGTRYPKEPANFMAVGSRLGKKPH